MRILKTLFQLAYKLYYILVFCLIFLCLYPFFALGFFLIKKDSYTYKLHVIWAKVLSVLTFISLDIKDENTKIPKGSYVIISNHTSFLDVFLMCLIFPQIPLVFMAKAELMSIPLFRMLFKYYHIPVYRKNRKKAAQSILQSEKVLERGLSLVIFPEGGIIDGYAPKLAPFKNGAFKLAKDMNVSIIPLTFLNNFKLVGEPTEIFSIARPGRAKVIVHPIVSSEEIQQNSLNVVKQKCFEIIEEPLKTTYQF